MELRRVLRPSAAATMTASGCASSTRVLVLDRTPRPVPATPARSRLTAAPRAARSRVRGACFRPQARTPLDPGFAPIGVSAVPVGQPCFALNQPRAPALGPNPSPQPQSTFLTPTPPSESHGAHLRTDLGRSVNGLGVAACCSSAKDYAAGFHDLVEGRTRLLLRRAGVLRFWAVFRPSSPPSRRPARPTENDSGPPTGHPSRHALKDGIPTPSR